MHPGNRAGSGNGSLLRVRTGKLGFGSWRWPRPLFTGQVCPHLEPRYDLREREPPTPCPAIAEIARQDPSDALLRLLYLRFRPRARSPPARIPARHNCSRHTAADLESFLLPAASTAGRRACPVRLRARAGSERSRRRRRRDTRRSGEPRRAIRPRTCPAGLGIRQRSSGSPPRGPGAFPPRGACRVHPRPDVTTCRRTCEQREFRRDFSAARKFFFCRTPAVSVLISRPRTRPAPGTNGRTEKRLSSTLISGLPARAAPARGPQRPGKSSHENTSSAPIRWMSF
jgi:hypothetical protein